MDARAAALAEDVRRHVPADALEESYRDAIVTLLTTSSDPFSRASWAPGHITAGVYIIDPAAERLLLHHHRRLDRWLQMGGHVEPGEDARTAALREGREESGLDDLELVYDAIFDLDVHTIPAARGEPEHRHFDVRFLARTSDPAKIRMDDWESLGIAWLPLDRAEALMNEAAASRAILKIHSHNRGRNST